ncbi:MAG: chemotaxis protein CheA, partial [Spirochaetales bacterium]
MSDYLDPNNQELLKDFFAEARSQVDALEQNILVLENDPGNRDAVDEIFRAAHTLKGGAGTVAMVELADFTHVLEDLLDAIRSDVVKVGEEVIDSLLAGIDIVKAMLDARADGSVFSGDSESVLTRLAGFLPKHTPSLAAKAAVKAIPKSQAQQPARGIPQPKSGLPLVQANSTGLTEYELLEMCEVAGTDRTVYSVVIDFDETNVMNTVSAIHAFAALRDIGTVLKTAPDFEILYEDAFYPTVTYWLASGKSPADIEATAFIPDVVTGVRLSVIQQDGSVLSTGMPQPAASSPTESRVHELQAVEVPKAPAAPKAEQLSEPTMAPVPPPVQLEAAEVEPVEVLDEHAEDRSGDARRAGQQAGNILRVDSKRIDNLLNLVSETVINKATFNQISTQFSEIQSGFQTTQGQLRDRLKTLFDELPEYLASIQSGRPIKEIKKEILEKYGSLYGIFDSFESDFKGNVAKFRGTAQNLGRITSELQEGVMRIRMVPISQIFSRFPRLIRDLSKSLSKKVKLEIKGEDTELDKSVIEDLLDPLMHSVRNALDHGIESVEERFAAGKPEEGTVMLRASNEGNMIVIEIADDGKGIDIEAVKRKAVERGIIHPNKALTELESFNLIFEPGFSTAASVTNISGRGVGLDVVKRQIEKLNGSVTVTSQRGKGTKFTIKLPLTLAIIQGLLVRVGKETYSIPITSVIESHRIKPSDIKMIDNYEVF